MPTPSFGGPSKPGQDLYYTRGRVEDKKKKAKKKGGGGGYSKIDPSAHAGSLAEMIEKQAAGQAAQAMGNNVVGGNPLASLMQDFMSQYNSINVAPTPFEELQRLAQGQVNAQFDPLIEMLRSQMDTKMKRGKESQTDAREMYGALSKDFLAQLPMMTQQFAAEDAESNMRYDNAQAELQKQYANQAKEQQAILQHLGIESAAPEASQQARDDQSYFQQAYELEQQSAMDQLNSQQKAAQDYQGQLGSTTKIAGENAAQDIWAQLENYLDQAGTQMMGLQNQKSSTLSSLLSQMQAQDSQRVQQQEQQQFDNLLAMSRFQLDATKAAGEAGGGPGGGLFGETTTGLQGAQNFLAEAYPGQDILAGNLMEQLQDVLSNPDVVKGKFQLTPGNEALGKGPTYSDVGQEMMMDLLRREIEKENQAQPGRYGNADINNAINALLAYMGKLR